MSSATLTTPAMTMLAECEPEPSSEATPLLRPAVRSSGRTPLPIRQLLVLACIRLAEPVNFTIIFPFVNEMIEHMKITDKPSEIGFYSGLVDSTFAFMQMFFIFHWGRLSDRVGRRPVIFIGLTGSIASITLFGLSKSLTWVLLARGLAGALSGNIAVIQSILGEITDATNEAQAMPLTSITWNIGCIIGPMLGGTLSTPARQYPNSFIARVRLFQDYPYLLPCLAGVSIALAALMFGYFNLEETKCSKDKKVPMVRAPPPRSYSTSRPESLKKSREHRTHADSGTSTASSSVSGTLFGDEEGSPSIKPAESRIDVNTSTSTSALGLLRHPPLQRVITSSFILSILGTSYDVVFSLLCYTPIHLGGLSRTPREIGYALAIGGTISTIMLPFGFPPIQRRYGTRKMYCTLMYFWPFVYLLFPILNVIARMLVQPVGVDGVERLTPAGDKILWLGIGIVVLLTRIACMMYSLNMMLVKFAAPNKESLGSTYGMSQTIACIARAGSPTFVSSLFALSVERQLLHGQAVWLIMTGIAFLGVFVSRNLPDPDQPQNLSA